MGLARGEYLRMGIYRPNMEDSEKSHWPKQLGNAYQNDMKPKINVSSSRKLLEVHFLLA